MRAGRSSGTTDGFALMSEPPRTRVRAAFARAGAVRDRVRSFPGGTLLWRILVTLVGVAIIVVGIILLPLPGPGWLIIFGGLGILASEYAWASRLLSTARRYVGAWMQWTLRQPLWVRALIGLAGFLIVAAALIGSWYVYRI